MRLLEGSKIIFFILTQIIFSIAACLSFSIGVAFAAPVSTPLPTQHKSMVTKASAVGSVVKGREWAALCMSCHGAHGISTKQIYPNLAGQKEAYLINAINEYKNGMRKDPTMVAMAAPLGAQVIADLAAFFSSLSPGH